MDKYTVDIATYASNLNFESIPENVINKAKELFIDWVACCYAGARSEVTQIIADVTSDISKKGGAKVLGKDQNESAFFAAFLNGSSSHAVELDDVHNASVFHPGATVIPAALAVAQEKKLSGKELLVAIIAGYEVSTRLGECLGLSHYKYFHTTATAGVIGATVAASYLLGHDSFKVACAIGNAGTLAGGLWQFLDDNSMSKQLHTGRAAADGVLSAYLSDKGLIGPTRILEGDRGLCNAMSENPDWSKLDKDSFDNCYKTLEVSLKPYSCCRHIHPGIDGVINLMKEHTIDSENIESINIHVYTNGYELLKNVKPDSSYTAKFSIQYCISNAILYGEVEPYMFEPSFLKNPKVLDYMKIVNIYPSEEMDLKYPAIRGSKVDIITKSNKKYSTTINYPKGDPENPLTKEELLNKFISLCQTSLERNEAHILFEKCLKMESSKDVSTLFNIGVTYEYNKL